jgi:nicotinamidase-related amidase
MLNDFVDKRGILGFKFARNIVPFIRERLYLYRMERFGLVGLEAFNVIYVCDSHTEDDLEFKRFPKHAIAGTWGAKIVDDLKPIEEALSREKIVHKTRFNGFYDTTLGPLLDELMPNIEGERHGKIEVVGVCTSICIMDTVGGLVERDHKVIVPVRGVADPDNDAHKFALDRMEKIYGAEIKE